MFLDIHGHVYRRRGFPQDGQTYFPTLEEMVAVWDAYGIDRVCLLPLIGPEVYLPESMDDVFDIVEAAGGRVIPFCNVDPRALTNTATAPLDALLRYYRDRGCRGIGEVMPNLAFLDARVQNLFRCAEAVGLPVIFDSTVELGRGYGLVDDPGLPQLEASLQRFAKLTILGHGPAFWSEIAELKSPSERTCYPSGAVEEEGAVVRLMRQYENLWCDLSAGSGFNAMNRDRTYAVRFLNEFQDRLAFGTDICTAGQAAPMIDLLLEFRADGRLSDAAFEKIAHGNAERLLKL